MTVTAHPSGPPPKAPEPRNIYALPPASPGSGELFEPLVQTGSLLIERIVSRGHATPPGEWYDQERDEWILLLTGSAELRYDGCAGTRRLEPGDCLLIPAGCRHRVQWTDPDTPTVWLAVHYPAPSRP